MTNKVTSKRVVSAAGAVVFTGLFVAGSALPANAAACKTVTEGYSHKVISVCGEKYTKGTGITQSNSGSDGVQLPLTGADVVGLGVVAVGLIGGGTVLVAAGRKRRATLAA